MVQEFRAATARWAQTRRNQSATWKDGVPPEPDYTPLDSSPWLHGPATERGPLPIEDQPETEASPVCIPLALQEVAESLTHEELYEVRVADQRLLDIDVPDLIFHKAVARRSSHNKKRTGPERRPEVAKPLVQEKAPAALVPAEEAAWRGVQGPPHPPAQQAQGHQNGGGHGCQA